MNTPWNLNRLLVVAGSFSVLLAGLAFSGWSFATFAKNVPQLVPGFPGWIFAIVLAFYARPWVYLVAGILNSLLPLMVLFLFGALFGLAQPLSGHEYQASLLLALALVLSLWGGIAGFVQGRKDAHTPIRGALSTSKGLGVSLLVAFVVGIMLTSGLASSAVKDMAAAGGAYNVVPDQTVTLELADFAFEPRTLTIPAGQLVEIQLVNKDTAGHTFTYETGGKTFDTFLPGDSTTKVLVRFDAPQEIPFWCKPHSGGKGDTSSDSMVGTLVVA